MLYFKFKADKDDATKVVPFVPPQSRNVDIPVYTVEIA
jgi:hypothetical protein